MRIDGQECRLSTTHCGISARVLRRVLDRPYLCAFLPQEQGGERDRSVNHDQYVHTKDEIALPYHMPDHDSPDIAGTTPCM